MSLTLNITVPSDMSLKYGFYEDNSTAMTCIGQSLWCSTSNLDLCIIQHSVKIINLDVQENTYKGSHTQQKDVFLIDSMMD